MRNADELKEWQRRFDEWSTLPSVQPGAKVRQTKWMQSTLKVLKLLAQKVGECRTNPDGMPSERLLAELKQAIDENDDMWAAGRFYREDDPFTHDVCNDAVNDDEEIEEPNRPVVSQIGKSIASAIRYEQGQWDALRKRARDDMDLILIGLRDRQLNPPIKELVLRFKDGSVVRAVRNQNHRFEYAATAAEGSVEDEQ